MQIPPSSRGQGAAGSVTLSPRSREPPQPFPPGALWPAVQPLGTARHGCRPLDPTQRQESGRSNSSSPPLATQPPFALVLTENFSPLQLAKVPLTAAQPADVAALHPAWEWEYVGKMEPNCSWWHRASGQGAVGTSCSWAEIWLNIRR